VLWLFLTAVLVIAVPSTAQEKADQPPTVRLEEDVEPRAIGHSGTLLVGFGGALDRAFSTQALMPLTYTVQIDAVRFVTNHIGVQVALSGSGSVGGDEQYAQPTGTGAPALHLRVGGVYFLTPKSMMSLYAGGSYSNQLTQRAGTDAGAVVATGGIQAVLSSRAALFVEGGYGFGLKRGAEGELVTSIIGQVGFRIRFR
jgi:hypothetical protein